jgi:hypothetical protein
VANDMYMWEHGATSTANVSSNPLVPSQGFVFASVRRDTSLTGANFTTGYIERPVAPFGAHPIFTNAETEVSEASSRRSHHFTVLALVPPASITV